MFWCACALCLRYLGRIRLLSSHHRVDTILSGATDRWSYSVRTKYWRRERTTCLLQITIFRSIIFGTMITTCLLQERFSHVAENRTFFRCTGRYCLEPMKHYWSNFVELTPPFFPDKMCPPSLFYWSKHHVSKLTLFSQSSEQSYRMHNAEGLKKLLLLRK